VNYQALIVTILQLFDLCLNQGWPKLTEEFWMMKQIQLGTLGFTTSEQGLGMMSVGITMGKRDLYGKMNDVSNKGVAELISRAIKAGVTHFDTAQIYTNISGMMLGSWFPTSNSAEKRMKLGLSLNRGKYQVATKVMKSGKKKDVKNMCYRSLKAMGIDCIDLYYVHRIDPKIPIEVTMEAMNELIAEGKIKYVGLSEASAETIRRAHAISPLTCVQMEWSLYSRELEDEIVPLCAELGIGIVAYAPMGRGLLADTSLDPQKMSRMDFRKMGGVGYAVKEDERNLAKSLETLAKEKNVPLGTLSLAWVHKKGRDALNGAGVVPIPGTGNPNHMEENAKAVALSYILDDADMVAIESCVPRKAMENLPRYGGGLGERVFTKENNISLAQWNK
jgi:aryl-alcohol dehydrogenase-like predicted oxidoreductase